MSFKLPKKPSRRDSCTSSQNRVIVLLLTSVSIQGLIKFRYICISASTKNKLVQNATVSDVTTSKLRTKNGIINYVHVIIV